MGVFPTSTMLMLVSESVDFDADDVMDFDVGDVVEETSYEGLRKKH